MKKRGASIWFFAAVFFWAMISGCASSPEPEPESGPDISPFEPGVYSSQATAEELYLSEPVGMSGTCSVPGTDKTGIYTIVISAYTDSHSIIFKWSDGSSTSAFVVNGNRKTLHFGTDTLWLWARSE